MYRRLKDLREDCDSTQQKLAQFLKISQATYFRYESSALDIPSMILIELSKLYDTSVDHIWEQTDEKKPYAKSDQKR
ncbi:helix-turn-helix domain-containing protein [Clostridium merdae]|uniref:helix-turn-helix domain-containing protein n=1 Tax=Clostridium merdae TaxID=1958780 RepID=UPI000A26D14E|nr:helix-turn-helix transcriptional regulator [Clostridium merdae]